MRTYRLNFLDSRQRPPRRAWERLWQRLMAMPSGQAYGLAMVCFGLSSLFVLQSRWQLSAEQARNRQLTNQVNRQLSSESQVDRLNASLRNLRTELGLYGGLERATLDWYRIVLLIGNASENRLQFKRVEGTGDRLKLQALAPGLPAALAFVRSVESLNICAPDTLAISRTDVVTIQPTGGPTARNQIVDFELVCQLRNQRLF